MTTTRPTILLIATELAGSNLAFSTQDGVTRLAPSTAGTTTTLTDTVAGPPFTHTNHDNWFMYRPAPATTGDKRRIIDSYSGATRSWTIQSTLPWVGAPQTSEKYLVLRNDPDLWNRALNTALQNDLFTVRYEVFTPTSETRLRYDLSAAPLTITVGDIKRRSQIVTLEYHNATEASGAEVWKPYADGIRTWDIEDNESTFTLVLNRGLSTANEYRLVYTVAYSPVTSETTEIAVDPNWAAWATLLVMGRNLGDMNNADDDWEVVRRRAQQEYDTRRRQILGRFGGKIVERSAAPVGGVSTGGRRGR